MSRATKDQKFILLSLHLMVNFRRSCSFHIVAVKAGRRGNMSYHPWRSLQRFISSWGYCHDGASCTYTSMNANLASLQWASSSSSFNHCYCFTIHPHISSLWIRGFTTFHVQLSPHPSLLVFCCPFRDHYRFLKFS